jgi:hypothetical protein
MAGERRGVYQVAYPISLERRKDAGLGSFETSAQRKSDADGEEIDLYFADS